MRKPNWPRLMEWAEILIVVGTIWALIYTINQAAP